MRWHTDMRAIQDEAMDALRRIRPDARPVTISHEAGA